MVQRVRYEPFTHTHIHTHTHTHLLLDIFQALDKVSEQGQVHGGNAFPQGGLLVAVCVCVCVCVYRYVR